MAASTPARYTAQVQVMTEPDTAAELRAWAAYGRMSQSHAAREVVEAGLRAMRKRWASEHGALPADVLEAAHREVMDQVGKALRRKRAEPAVHVHVEGRTATRW
jgi:hypothetical protein